MTAAFYLWLALLSSDELSWEFRRLEGRLFFQDVSGKVRVSCKQLFCGLWGVVKWRQAVFLRKVAAP